MIEFEKAVNRVRYPYEANPLEIAKSNALESVPPKEVEKYEDPSFSLLVCLCQELARLNPSPKGNAQSLVKSCVLVISTLTMKRSVKPLESMATVHSLYVQNKRPNSSIQMTRLVGDG